MSRLVTQQDIANRLGIDQKTVSLALGAPHRIRPETRDRVLAAAKAMGYRPNRLAAGLRGGRTRSVGLIWTLIDPWTGDSMIAKELLERMQQRGYATYQAQHSQHVEVTCQQLDDFIARRADGIILQEIPSVLMAPEIVQRLEHFELVLGVSREPIPGFPGDLLIHDRNHAIRQVVDHFARTGRRRPAFVTSMGEESNPPKFSVFREQCRVRGIKDHPNLLINLDVPQTGEEHGRLHLEGFCRQFPKTVDVDAIFCFNDIGAMYIIRELQRRGLRVPQDVAVVGFNDLEAGRLWQPALASGDRRCPQVADAMDQMLEQRLADPDRPWQQRTVHMEFIWRESAG